jgi:hypothetical protein|tara:strand:+ start:118 stop:393 length:276 start_codon:yes stop_codon:yes gene_type:complete
MKRKNLLEKVINQSLKKDINLMFGEGSYISIDVLKYVGNKKNYLVHAKLYLTNIEDGMFLFPDGVNMLINLGWKVVGNKKPLIISSSVDIK